MPQVGKRYPTCQRCGKWFKNWAAARLHVATHPGHTVR